MSTLYAASYKGESLHAFIADRLDAGLDAAIDVRLKNTSHLVGYTKLDDLAFLLQSRFGISYKHRPELAPTEEIRGAYRDQVDGSGCTRRFLPLLRERPVEEQGRWLVARYTAPRLLGAETTPDLCHRRLVAEYWTEHIPDLTIVHL